MCKNLRVFAIFMCLLCSTGWGQSLNPGAKSGGQIGRDIEARVLYPAGKTFQYHCLFPLIIEYQNNSNTKQEFELTWSISQKVPSQYRKLVLEPGAKKRLPLLFPPRTVGQLYELKVNGQDLNPGLGANSQGQVIGILATGDDSFDYLRSLQVEKNQYYNPNNKGDTPYSTPQAVGNLDPAILPEHWAALESLQTIICYDLSSLSLSKAQYEALGNWVRQGGNLVLVSNGIPDEFRNSALEGLLPLKPSSVSESKKMLRVSGPRSSGANVDHSILDEPLLVSHSLLDGKVFFLTVPLLNVDLLGKDETTVLWRKIFDSSLSQPHSNPRLITYSMLNNLPELPRAQAGWIALFVLLYGIIVGPLNLSLLRRKDKMLWSFITVPVVAVLFAGSAYVVNRVIRPSIPITRELGWLHLQNKEQVGLAESEQILFSPHSSTFHLASDPSTLFDVYQDYGGLRSPRQLGMYEISPEGGLKSNLEMGTWDVQRFHNQSVLKLEKGISIEWEAEHKKITIDTPLESDGESAMLVHPVFGGSQAFQLKKGSHSYELSFSKVLPASVLTFDATLHPGRSEMLNAVENYHKMNSTKAKLFFWTAGIQMPIQINQGIQSKHDYLVGVEFEA